MGTRKRAGSHSGMDGSDKRIMVRVEDEEMDGLLLDERKCAGN